MILATSSTTVTWIGGFDGVLRWAAFICFVLAVIAAVAGSTKHGRIVAALIPAGLALWVLSEVVIST